jgi:hypothetical protein
VKIHYEKNDLGGFLGRTVNGTIIRLLDNTKNNEFSENSHRAITPQ